MVVPVCSQTRWDKTFGHALSCRVKIRLCRYRDRDLQSISMRSRCDLARETKKNDATGGGDGAHHRHMRRGSSILIVSRRSMSKKEKTEKVLSVAPLFWGGSGWVVGWDRVDARRGWRLRNENR